MINNKYRKIFLFTVLLILLIGVASAANVDDGTTSTDHAQTVTDTVDDNITHIQKVL